MRRPPATPDAGGRLAVLPQLPPPRLAPPIGSAVMSQPPPIPRTGDDASDEELALLRSTTQAIHSAQRQVEDMSVERMRLVLSLRERGVLFRLIADAVPTTEQTIYKIHREAKKAREEGKL